MAVLSVQTSTTGQVPNTSGAGIGMTQQLPTIVYIETNDTLATVTTTGYLTHAVTYFGYVFNNYQMAEVYTTDSGTVFLRLSVTTSSGHLVYSLVAPAESGSITTPTVANQIAYATNTLGTIAATGLTTALFNAGNISAGLSTGTAGILESYPSAATSGKLQLVGVASSGNFAVSISNASYGQASTVSFADVGSSAGRFLVSNTATPFVSGNFPKASGTGGLMVDSGIAVTALQLSANIKAAQVSGLGGSGAGPLTVTAAGCTTSSIVNVTILASSNAASVSKVVPGTGNFALTVSADPGAVLTIQYSMFIAAQ